MKRECNFGKIFIVFQIFSYVGYVTYRCELIVCYGSEIFTFQFLFRWIKEEEEDQKKYILEYLEKIRYFEKDCGITFFFIYLMSIILFYHPSLILITLGMKERLCEYSMIN